MGVELSFCLLNIRNWQEPTSGRVNCDMSRLTTQEPRGDFRYSLSNEAIHRNVAGRIVGELNPFGDLRKHS